MAQFESGDMEDDGLVSICVCFFCRCWNRSKNGSTSECNFLLFGIQRESGTPAWMVYFAYRDVSSDFADCTRTAELGGRLNVKTLSRWIWLLLCCSVCRSDDYGRA